MTPIDKFKEVLKERNLDYDDYFAIMYAAIDLGGASRVEGIELMFELQKQVK